MESRSENSTGTTTTAEPAAATTEKLISDLKTLVQRAEEKAVEQAKVADRVIREHPYHTLGIAFGLGVLIGVLVRRR